MLGFEPTPEQKRKSDRAMILHYRAFQYRLKTNTLTEEDKEYIAACEKFENETPTVEIVWEDDDAANELKISNFCHVCDYHRDEKSCEGKKYKCEKFKNRYDVQS